MATRKELFLGTPVRVKAGNYANREGEVALISAVEEICSVRLSGHETTVVNMVDVDVLPAEQE